MYDFSTLLERFTLFRTLATWKSITRRSTTALREVSSMNGWPLIVSRGQSLRETTLMDACVNHKPAKRKKVKKFVIKDGVLHYIAKEWMHIHKKSSKQPRTTRITFLFMITTLVPLGVYRTERPLPKQEQCMALHAVITCKTVIIYLFRPNDSFRGY